MANIEKLIEELSALSIIEASELVKSLEEKWGISAASFAAAPGAAAGAAAEEKTEFNVILVSGGDKKLEAIKVVREITGLGLKEAKDLVEGAPKPVKEGVDKKTADEIKVKLEAIGAKVEIK